MALYRIIIYLVLMLLWRVQDWPAWTFLLTAIFILFGTQYLCKEYPFSQRR